MPSASLPRYDCGAHVVSRTGVLKDNYAQREAAAGAFTSPDRERSRRRGDPTKLASWGAKARVRDRYEKFPGF